MFKAMILSALCVALCACGGSSSPSGPSSTSSTGSSSSSSNNNNSSSCASVGPLGSAKGTITATINGSTFNGGVPAGLSIYTPVAAVPALGLPAQDFITISGTCGDLTTVQILARAVVGTTTIGVDASGNPLTDPQTKQPLVHNALLQLRANGVAAGTWITSLLGGTGSITVSTVSTTAATGSFTLTMVPQANTGATGNKTVVGQFSVTF